MKLGRRGGLALVLAGAALALGGCSGSACRRACDKIAQCRGGESGTAGTRLGISLPRAVDAGPPASSWQCPIGDSCDPKNSCLADCVEAATCGAITGASVAGAAALAECQAACAAQPLLGEDPDASQGDGEPGRLDDARGATPDGAICSPSCAGKQCGADGCGGSCGDCAWPQVCDQSAGRCISSCVAHCGDRTCGDDGCGGSCGTCSSPAICNAQSGQCETVCTPSCAGKQCGDDGCGGSCGTCSTGSCQAGLCVAPPSAGFGAYCDANTACQSGYECILLQGGSSSAGFCSASCPTFGVECSGAPTGTLAGCIIDDGAGGNLCGFVCLLEGQSFPCPGSTSCQTQDDPPGRGQRICLP